MPTGDALCLTSFFSYVVECTAFHCTYALGGFLLKNHVGVTTMKRETT
jgi:hypothetical protein